MSSSQEYDPDDSLQPDNYHGNENCLELWDYDQYYFNDNDCEESTSISPLCETTPVNTINKI